MRLMVREQNERTQENRKRTSIYERSRIHRRAGIAVAAAAAATTAVAAAPTAVRRGYGRFRAR